MMTYHEFLREVWAGINRSNRVITFDTFDIALFPALSRIAPKLHRQAEIAMTRGEIESGIPALLRYLEAHWPTPTPGPSTGLIIPWRKRKETDART